MVFAPEPAVPSGLVRSRADPRGRIFLYSTRIDSSAVTYPAVGILARRNVRQACAGCLRLLDQETEASFIAIVQAEFLSAATGQRNDKRSDVEQLSDGADWAGAPSKSRRPRARCSSSPRKTLPHMTSKKGRSNLCWNA